MLYFARGSITDKLSKDDLRAGLFEALKKLGPRKHVLAVPPDFTRLHSKAGLLTSLVHEFYCDKLTDVLPALGTHSPMTHEQIAEMFPGVPEKLFRVHNWRTGITTVGDVLELLDKGESAVMSIRNFGEKSLDELRQKMHEKGFLKEDETPE